VLEVVRQKNWRRNDNAFENSPEGNLHFLLLLLPLARVCDVIDDDVTA